MGLRGVIRQSAFAVALLAMAMLSLATTRSVVMQASDASPDMMISATCMSLTGAPMHGKGGALPDKAHKLCEYCAAAAHAPVCATVAPIPVSSNVAWSAYAVLQPLGPRGPPAFAANARGPPQIALTI
jgi:hypothetical protein